MNIYVLGGLLTAAPALSFWISYPRRRWAAWLAAAAAFAVWAAGFTLIRKDDWTMWFALGAWSMFGGFYATYVVERNAADYRKLDRMVKERVDLKAKLTASVNEAKGSGARTESQQREVMALYGMVKGLAEALNWEEVRPKLEMAVQNYLGLEEFALYVADLRAQNTLHPLVTRHLSNSVGSNWDTLARYFQDRKVPLTVPHLMEAPEKAVCCPIRESNELMGYFFGRLPAGADGKALVRKAESFVAEISFAFRRVKLFQEMERLSMVDGLTGVYRRGMFDNRIREEVVRAKTFKTSFCLVLLDIDHFKKLNDTYGHPFGDQVLRRIGELLKGNVYETDFVARYGGEEFALLLPRADPVGVLRKANSVRQAVERESFPLAAQTIKVTISMGVSHFPRDGVNPESIIHLADQALYFAKETGRNRVVDIVDVPADKRQSAPTKK